MAEILVIGLNPAWQKVLIFSEFSNGAVNRAVEMHECASGKGLNTAGVLQSLGHHVTVLQITGGGAGKKIVGFCRKSGLGLINISCGAQTRTCTTVINRKNHTFTELIEPFKISPEESKSVSKSILTAVKKCRTNFDAAVFCGQAPEGLPANIYGEILKETGTRLTIVDAYKNIPMSFFKQVDIIKINRGEYKNLSSRFRNFELAVSVPGNKHLMITDGSKPAEYRRLWRIKNEPGTNGKAQIIYPLPPVKKIVNPTGAGDAVTAGVTHFCLKGLPEGEAFKNALRLGAKSCETILPGRFS